MPWFLQWILFLNSLVTGSATNAAVEYPAHIALLLG